MRPRLATLTLNPAVDMACSAPSVRPTHKIRTVVERFDAGGGGINVARVLHALGDDVVAVVMTGGVTGHLIEELLDEAGVAWRSIEIRGRTRISLNVRDEATGLEYRFVPEGPTIGPEDVRRALELLRDLDVEWLIASGSLPPGAPADFYAQAAAATTARGQKFALDTSGPPLRAAIGSGIELLKLSLSELEFVAGRALPTQQMQHDAVATLLQSGTARMIAVSMGSAGASLATTEEVIAMPALPVQVRSAVGAGDSFLAGLVSGLARGLTLRKTLALGIAAGTAAVTGAGTAQVSRAAVEVRCAQLCGGQASVSAVNALPARR